MYDLVPKPYVDTHFRNTFRTNPIQTSPTFLWSQFMYYIIFYSFKHDLIPCNLWGNWGSVVWRVWVGSFRTFLHEPNLCVLPSGQGTLVVSRPKPVLQSLEHDQHVNIKFTSILTRTNLNWRCLSRICFLEFLFISYIKATKYKNDENLENSFHLNFARLSLSGNLGYKGKYYIAKRLVKLLLQT